MNEVWVIMPNGQGNTLAWSSACWPSKQSAEEYLDQIADGNTEWRAKWWVRPLKLMPGSVIDNEQAPQAGTTTYTIPQRVKIS